METYLPVVESIEKYVRCESKIWYVSLFSEDLSMSVADTCRTDWSGDKFSCIEAK